MFKKILIANRGEIALRIMRTLQTLGIQSVAIYSSADRFHPHVQMANEAYWVGDAAPNKSYLNIDKIIQIAKLAKVDAIHPGYGFLSENPEFARACEKAKIVFIGPSSTAMENVGSKQKAKFLLQNTQVPLVPGFNPSNPSDEELFNAAKQMGFPLVIKAAHGGGGKGLKIVHDMKEWKNALQSARREARAYFNNDELLLEKFIENPRHLEVQIFGDHSGQIIHLFERDCSVQRRQQKIVEEAPAIHLSHELRQQLYQHAIEVGKTFKYTNAGTVEFLLTPDQKLYFMEMNARLQVEHPITEAITGLDLVELQIHIAQRLEIPFPQPQKPIGHAIECRICAEQPQHDFKPSQGQINRLIWPKFGRVDTGIECHQIIQAHYDSLLAKEIAWGETREKAIIEMQNMLQETDIFGIESNLDYLKVILDDKTWQKGAVPIHFLLNHRFQNPSTPISILIIVGCALELSYLYEKNELPDSWMHFSNGSLRFWPIEFKLHDELYFAKIYHPRENHMMVEFENNHFEVFFQFQAHRLSVEVLQQTFTFQVDKKINYFTIHDSFNSYELHQVIRSSARLDGPEQETKIRSPMPATIVALYKKTGDSIIEGEPLLVLEAMKMEHTIYAPKNALIKEIYYQQGQQVQDGSELVELSYDE